MNTSELAQTLAHAAAGAEVRIEAGEFEGPWVFDRPVRLVGVGPATVLWSYRGPVVTIRAPNVKLENLAIEVTEEPDGIALLVDDSLRFHTPSLSGVRLHGRGEGLEPGGCWRVPAVIDLGQVMPNIPIERVVNLETNGSVVVRSELAGLEAEAQQVGGRTKLRLVLDGSGLTPGYLLDGRMEVQAGGLSSLIRLIGQIVATRTLLIRADQPSRQAPNTGRQLPALQEPAPASSTVREIVFGSRARRARSDPKSPQPAPPALIEPAQPSDSWIEALLKDAAGAVAAGHDARAIELLLYAIKLHPDQPRPHAELAAIYTQSGHFAASCREWEEVYRLDPGFLRIHEQLGRSYNLLNRYDDAIRILSRGLRDNQNDFGLLSAVVMSYFQTRRLAEALWAIDRALALQVDPKLMALKRMIEHQTHRAEGAL